MPEYITSHIQRKLEMKYTYCQLSALLRAVIDDKTRYDLQIAYLVRVQFPRRVADGDGRPLMAGLSRAMLCALKMVVLKQE